MCEQLKTQRMLRHGCAQLFKEKAKKVRPKKVRPKKVRLHLCSEPCLPRQRRSEASPFSIPLLRQLRLCNYPDVCTCQRQQALPLVRIMPLEPEASWWCYGTHLHLGSLLATAWTARPMRMVVSERQEQIVVLGYGGEQQRRHGSTTWPCAMAGQLSGYGRDSFDTLIDDIKQNLGEPLTRTDLEARSHHSRRVLQ